MSEKFVVFIFVSYIIETLKRVAKGIDHELINGISCDISIITKESEPPKKKKKLIEKPNNSPTTTESGKLHENTRLADSRLTKVTLKNRKFPTFHIAEKDKVYVYKRSFNTKNSIVGICSVDNCDARCKIIPNEILLISKDPNGRRLQ